MANDARATRPQGAADGKFPLACRSAHQQQVGDIGASNQQHQTYRPQHDQQRFTRVAHNAVAQGLDVKLLVGIGPGEFAMILSGGQLELGSCLREGNAWPQPSGDLKEVVHVGADRLEPEG